MKTTILLLLLFLFVVADLVLRNRYPQVIQPFALGYNVVYTVLSAAYVIFLIYQYSTGATTWHLVLVVCSIVVRRPQCSSPGRTGSGTGSKRE